MKFRLRVFGTTSMLKPDYFRFLYCHSYQELIATSQIIQHLIHDYKTQYQRALIKLHEVTELKHSLPDICICDANVTIIATMIIGLALSIRCRIISTTLYASLYAYVQGVIERP